MECPFDLENKKQVEKFTLSDPYNIQNTIVGYINKRQGNLYGALWITHVNGKEVPQLIYSAPKQHYPFDKNNEWEFPEYDRIELYEKIDGCLQADTPILTDKGYIRIGKIVNSQMDVKVASYNPVSNIVEFKDIVYYHKEKRLRDFLNIIIKSKRKCGREVPVICTDNHKFLTLSGWKRADELKIGEKIYHYNENISKEIEEIILGCLLGDSSVCWYKKNKSSICRSITFLHSIKQSDYFDYKKRLFGNLFTECKGNRGGFKGSSPNRRGQLRINQSVTNLIMSCCEVNNKKFITDEWVDRLTPLSIAFWYMDDGSCHFGDKQRPRATFSTYGFSFKEVEKLKQMFKNKYHIESSIYSDKKMPILVINADGTEKLFEMIYQYICPSMKYKISKIYENAECKFLNSCFTLSKSIVETYVIDINKDIPKDRIKKLVYQYDIQVKDNSNYFANGILVHNTCIVSFVYHNANGNMFLSYKTRLRPFLGSGRYGNFFALWNEMLIKYPKLSKMCYHGGLNFVFELYGKRNKILVDYDEILDIKNIFAIRVFDGSIIIPIGENPFGIPYVKLEGILDMATPEKYNEIKEELEKQLIIDENTKIIKGKEGLVWYFMKDGKCTQIKNKPPSILKYHWSGDAIAHESIYTTVVNAFENWDNPTYDNIVELLKEEFMEDKIEKSRVRIEKALTKVFFEKKSCYEILEFYKTLGIKITEDKGTVMRALAEKFPKQVCVMAFPVVWNYETSQL